MDKNIFERNGIDTMSVRNFNALATFFLTYGFLLISGIAYLFERKEIEISIWHFAIGGLFLPILGVILAVRDNRWWVSLIAYHLLTLSLATTWALLIEHYYPYCIQYLFLFAAICAAMTGIASVIFPSIEKYRKINFVTDILSFAIAGGVFLLIEPANSNANIAAFFIGVAIGILGNVNIIQAELVPKNLDTAVDIAVELYRDPIMSIVRLFKNQHSSRRRFYRK